MERTNIDKTLNRIFKKHIGFEKGRQTRNPNSSNARYSLSKLIAIDSFQAVFALYDLIEEEWCVAYKRRVASVAVSRKKKVAVDAIKSIVNGVFLS